MAALGSLVVELSANIAKFEAGMSRANYVANRNMRDISNNVQGLRQSFDALPMSIGKMYVAFRGLEFVSGIFKKAITSTDEFRLSVIGIAAALTNISEPGQGDIGNVFKRNAEYAKQMARELERVAAATPAEPAEMMVAYNQLVQQGYALRLEEADALGVIVTRIKLATAGQDANRQINQEIRAVMQGQAVQGALIAQELQSRVGPAWKEIVQSHIKAGDLLKWWASLYPGIVAAGKEFEGTLTAQTTTLEGHLKYLGREGLGGMYDAIVGKVQELNDYLREHEDIIANRISYAYCLSSDALVRRIVKQEKR